MSSLFQLYLNHHPEYEYIRSQNPIGIFELEGVDFRKRTVSESLKIHAMHLFLLLMKMKISSTRS
jgi:hypothetical protein